MTPAQRHGSLDRALFEKRMLVYKLPASLAHFTSGDNFLDIHRPLCQTSCRSPVIADDPHWSAIHDNKSTFN